MKKMLNMEKEKIANLYLEQYKNNQSIYQYDLSTGSGKTYSYFKTFSELLEKEKEKNNNLNPTINFYIAPFKSHLVGNIEEIGGKNSYGAIIYASGDIRFFDNGDPIAWYQNCKDVLKQIKNEMEFSTKKIKEKYGRALFQYNFYEILMNIKNEDEIKIASKDLSIKLNKLKQQIDELENEYSKYQNTIDKKDLNLIDLAKHDFNNAVKKYNSTINYYLFEIISFFKKYKNKFLYYRDTNHELKKEVDYLIKIISIFNPYYLSEIFNNVYLLMTNQKMLTSQGYYKVDDKKCKFVSFRGKNLFECLAEKNDGKREKTNFLNYYIPNLEVNVFIDESEDGFEDMLEKMIKENSEKINLPQFVTSFITEFYLTSYKNKDYKKIYDFIKKPTTGSIPKNETKPEKLLRSWMKEDATNSKGMTIKDIKNEIKGNDKLMEIFNIFVSKVKTATSHKNIIAASNIFNLIEEKLKLLNIDVNTFNKIIEIHKTNTIKDFYIDKDLYNKKSNTFSQIFYKQNISLSFSNKEELKSMFIKIDNSIDTFLELVDENKIKNNSEKISLYDYLLVTFLLFNLLKNKNTGISNVLNDIMVNNQKNIINSTTNLLDIHKKLNKKEYEVISIDNIQESNLNDEKEFNLTEKFLYEETKLVIKLKNSESYETTSDSDYINLSLEINLGLSSPEELIMLPIKNNSCNKYNLFLVSATGGWKEDIVSQFNLEYLEKQSKVYNFQTNLDPESESYKLLEEQIFSLNELRKKQKDISIFILENIYKSNKNLIEFNKEFKSYIESNKYLSKYKHIEIDNFLSSLEYLSNNDKLYGMIGITQTTRHIKDILFTLIYDLNESNLGGLFAKNSYIQFKFNEKYKDSNGKNIFQSHTDNLVIDCFINNKKITIIFFKSKMDTQFESKSEKKFKEEFLTINDENHKVLVFSDYENVLKGLSFKLNIFGETRDFDSLVYLMDRYYKKFNEEYKELNNMMEIIMKIKYVIKEKITDKTLNNLEELNQDENYTKFREKMNIISFFKEIVQGNGRIERTDVNKYSEIIINKETYKRILLAIKQIESNSNTKHQLKRLSPNNQFLYNFYKIEYNKHIIEDREFYERFKGISIENNVNFINKINSMLEQIELMKKNKYNDEIVNKWEILRSKLMFIDFNTYLNYLEKYFKDDDLIYAITYLNKEELKESFDKLIYLNSNNLLSDLSDADKEYNLMNMLRLSIFENTIDQEASKIIKPYLEGIEKLEKLDYKIPYPFLQRIVSASLLEHMLKDYIEKFQYDNNILKDYEILDKEFYKKYPSLYELFDVYVKDEYDNIYCIDAKNWSKKYNLYESKLTGKKPTYLKILEKKEILERFFEPEKLKFIYVNLIDDGEQHKEEKHYNSCFLFEKSFDKEKKEHVIKINKNLIKIMEEN